MKKYLIKISTLFFLTLMISHVAMAKNHTASENKKVKTKTKAGMEINYSTSLYGALFGAERFYDNNGFGLELKIGKRDWRFFAAIQFNRFKNSAIDYNAKDSVLNIGAGFSNLYFNRHMVFKFSAGPAFLLNDSLEHQKGSSGFYVDLKPLGFRIRLSKSYIDIFPITLLWEMPATTSVPILYINYRFAVSAGFNF
ncbi:MAG: hypothetical protein JXR91_01465 [Deltaproteobacteria bacterium]|nr:hypothetical protein [Deltaproteobacteria bacterium]